MIIAYKSSLPSFFVVLWLCYFIYLFTQCKEQLTETVVDSYYLGIGQGTKLQVLTCYFQTTSVHVLVLLVSSVHCSAN